MKKLMMTAVVALTVMSGRGDEAVFARATGASMRLDTREGVRLAAQGASETIAYSPRWGADGHSGRVTLPECTVSADGAVLKTASEEGVVAWSPDSTGAHTLTHTAGDVTYTAQFTVLGDDVAQHAGALVASEKWASNLVHLVTGEVVVPSGVTLTIEPGTVVKFMPGAKLRVAAGGACVAKGVVFTHVADDSVGGDTLVDGSESLPVMEDYEIIGSVTDDETTEYRYSAPVILSGTISSNTRWRGWKVYHVTGNLTVASGVTLTVEPGCVVKFDAGRRLTVNSGATLLAQGTRAAPIVFTSVKDDDWGGDTNGDGGDTRPKGGNWTGLYVNGTASLAYCTVMYAAPSNERGNIECQSGGRLTMNGCTVAHSLYDGVWNWGGTIRITNSIFIDCGNAVCPYQGSTTCDNCVMFECNYGYMDWSHWVGGTFRNCIFYGMGMNWSDTNGAAEFQPHSTVKNCCFYNPEGYSKRSCVKSGVDGCLYADPKFLDPDNGDFRIAADSPCVDAGDGTVAPERDYYGQPRMNLKRTLDKGVPNAEGVCPDIGIYEVPGVTTVPVPDLEVLSVTGANAAIPGEGVSVTYVVTNRGSESAVGTVRDRIVLKGVAELGGQEVAVGLVEQQYSLAVGAAATCTAKVKCPAVKSGNWIFGVTVNAERDVFEQNFTHNTGWATAPMMIELESIEIGVKQTTVASGTTKGFSLGAGVRTIRVSGGSEESAAALKVYGAIGAVPVSAGDGIAALRLDDGSWLLVLPDAESGEKGYVVVENAGKTAVEVMVNAEESKLSVLGVSPNRVPAVDGVSVTITGTGFEGGQTVTLGGRSAKSIVRLNDVQIVATFDLMGIAAGSAHVKVDGNAAGVHTFPIDVYKTTQGPKLEATLELPTSVRDGRIYTAYVVYANVGDEPMTMPIFRVEREDSSSKLGLSVAETLTETRVFVGGISQNHPAGVLQPGDSGRIPVYFQPFGAYKLRLSHTKETDNTEQFAAFGGVKSYLAAMSDAATRLNLRGRAEYNVHDFVDQATWENEGYACAAVSGYLRDAMTREPIAHQVISLVATNETVATVVRATTDERGYFQIRNVPDGDYRWMLDVANARLPMTVVTVSDQCDVNDVTVLVTLAGRISGHAVTTDGFPLYGATVVLYGAEGHVQQKTVTDDFGAFLFEGVPESTYSVRCASIDGYVCTSVEDVVVDAASHAPVVELALAPGGRISGTVSSEDGQITGGTVAAITEGGDVLEVQCEADGTYLFDGLPAGNYTMQFYSTDYLSEGPSVAVTVGDDVQVNLVAQERPLFVATSTMGFGSLTTSFVLVDKCGLTNVTAWAWDFDDDGKVDSTEAEPTWTYRSLGTNTVSLTITTSDGEKKVSRFKDCCIVEKPLETIYKSGAIVYGVNYGTLSVVSAGENTIRMSGHPAEGELAVGRAILGKAGEEWFLYRILSAKQNGDEWVLGVEEGKMTDIYEQCSIAVSSTVVVEDDRPVLKSVSPTSKPKFAAASTPAPEPIPLEDENGFKVFAQGGLKVTTEVHPKISLDMREVIINGEVVSERTAFVGSLNFDYVFEGYGELGAKYEAKLGVPLIPIGTPTPVPGVTFDASAELYAILQASAKGSIYAPGRLTAAIQVGREIDRDGNVRWLPPVKVNNQVGDLDMDVSGNFLVQIGLKPSFKVRAFLTASFGAAIDCYVKGEGSFTTSAAAKFEESVGMNVDYELNLIDWEFPWVDIKVGAGLEYEIAKYVFARYVAPTPDFLWIPYNPDPREEVEFLSQCKDGFVELFGKRRPVPPSGYRWNIGGSTAEYKDLKTHFAREGRYPASLKVKGGYIVGPFADEHTVTVGKPEEIPADGESQNDSRGGGRPAQSSDPNEIAGLVGAGDPDTQRVVKPGEWMSYTIYFENKESASADAQEVKVTNPLSEYLDWSSFEMGEVAFNNQIDLGLSGKQNAQHEETLRGTERSVRTTVSLDQASGKVTWAMRIVDPKGLLGWPDDGGGFLPPNDSTHRGEGHLSYRIKVRDDAPAGVRIENAASIVFDYNEPIVTDPAWWNTVGQMVAVDGKTGSGVKSTIMVDPNWVKANVGAGATDAQIAEVLNGTGANGLKVWQSIALGLDSENAEDKFLVDVPQNDEVETVSVKALKGALPECAWMPIKYRLDADATGSGVATQGAAQDAADFGIDIGGADDPTGIYSVTAVFSDDEGSDFAEVLAANQIGILRKKAANKREIVPVPWTKFAAGAEEIAVSNLVKTAGLSAGDKLYVYDDSAKRYATWELQSDKTWKPVKTVKMVNGKLEVQTADSPEVATVKRGSGVWLERQDITKPIHFVGQHDAAPVEVSVEAGTTGTPKWNLVASPLLTDWDLNSVNEGVNVADRIIVPTGKEPRIYTRDAANAKWGYITYEANAKGIVKPVRKEDDTMLKAGTGFWYVSEGGAPTLRWREASEK